MMDSLHGMLKSLSSETTTQKQATLPAPHHLDVFREFLSHLDRVKRRPSPRPRAKPKARASKR